MDERHILFAECLLIGASVGDAYAEAFGGNTSRSRGYKLQQREDVRKYLEHLRTARGFRTGVTADMVVEEMARIAFSDVRDFVEYDGEYLDIKDLDEVEDTTPIKQIKITNRYDKKTGLRVSQTKEITLYDKLGALGQLGKHTGALKEQIDVTSGGEPLKEQTVVNINHRKRGEKIKKEQK